MGPTQVLSSVREKYWILKGGAAVRAVLKKCIKCKRWKAKPQDQIMAPLQLARVTPDNPPFTFVGIDYFGPIQVKVKRSYVRRYGCVFSCLTMRAVHIELTTDSFLQAFSRFVSRRGPPREVFSDNGTNFKGAEEDVREALKTWNQDRIRDTLRENKIEWHFNPPKASHTGRLWERMIGSIRRILRVLLANQTVDDEILSTMMAETENILNDRPLTRITADPNDLEPLTPNKLLLVYRNPCIAPGDFSVLADRFTKRWSVTHSTYPISFGDDGWSICKLSKNVRSG
ncbi:uncharacterized protein LOC116610277 [Nematostella vectensis]|uniref:uncharacterized protein LOC116610277 n=1 Tax=Nematostella vectensis TaxID=45351 RepID=UPI001390425E|nr:uncharacterized protein LOC116610277 [Nematostella vectensis]